MGLFAIAIFVFVVLVYMQLSELTDVIERIEKRGLKIHGTVGGDVSVVAKEKE